MSNNDTKADEIINGMIKQVVATAIIPAHVNWAFTASLMSVGVVRIGNVYGVPLNKDEAWKLIKQFFKAASFWFMGMQVGAKAFAAIMQSTGLGYLAGVALDATISAALAYSIGGAAKAYFQGETDKEIIGEIVQDLFKQGKIKFAKDKLTSM